MGIRDYEFRGRTYDQWELGEEFITGARTITEADIVNFAGLSGDWSATHTNDVYGKSTIYGSRIAYGNVTFIVSTGLLAQTLMFGAPPWPCWTCRSAIRSQSALRTPSTANSSRWRSAPPKRPVGG